MFSSIQRQQKSLVRKEEKLQQELIEIENKKSQRIDELLNDGTIEFEHDRIIKALERKKQRTLSSLENTRVVENKLAEREEKEASTLLERLKTKLKSVLADDTIKYDKKATELEAVRKKLDSLAVETGKLYEIKRYSERKMHNLNKIELKDFLSLLNNPKEALLRSGELQIIFSDNPELSSDLGFNAQKIIEEHKKAQEKERLEHQAKRDAENKVIKALQEVADFWCQKHWVPEEIRSMMNCIDSFQLYQFF